MVWPEITVMELIDIEGNMIAHWTADMFDGTVHEFVEHNFQELKLELAMRY
jgi:pantothenate kinase-related protein Tda10